MPQYRINPEDQQKFQKRFRWIMIVAAVIIVGSAVTNSVIIGQGDLLLTLIPIVVILGFFGFTFMRSFKKQQSVYSSYTITLTDSDITREQQSLTPLTINFMEIKDIVRTKKGHFRIRGRESTDVIHIPRTIENADDLLRRLQEFAPVEMDSKAPMRSQYKTLAMLAVGIAAFVGFLEIPDPKLAGVCGLVLVAGLIWLFYYLQTNKNLPAEMKRRNWFMLLVIASMAYATWLKFTAG